MDDIYILPTKTKNNYQGLCFTCVLKKFAKLSEPEAMDMCVASIDLNTLAQSDTRFG